MTQLPSFIKIHILMYLSRSASPRTATEIAHYLRSQQVSVQTSNLASILYRLGSQGLIHRSLDPQHKIPPSKYNTITDRGRQWLSHLSPVAPSPALSSRSTPNRSLSPSPSSQASRGDISAIVHQWITRIGLTDMIGEDQIQKLVIALEDAQE